MCIRDRDYTDATVIFRNADRNIARLRDEFSVANTSIGAYYIKDILGEGSCSIVYEAERRMPIKQRVALKVIKAGMDSKAIISRFETEKQTLAMMEHPNIAHVIDAGETDTGRPFFVMEYIRGEIITDYSKVNDLTVEERLRLMISVCSAVQHAHNKGVIHRDLKPSNILVTVIDGVAIPKVIDFGIAKATEGESYKGDTVQGQWVGTPAYMSPEQFDRRSRDVDTRSDIYSLGMILYELITDEAAFDNKELMKQGLQKVRERMLHETPLSPDKRCAATHRRIRKELNLIILKAIHKNRDERYETVSEFSADISAFLANQPIKAHPQTNWYYLSKMVSRNRMISIAGAITVSTVVIGFSISTYLFFKVHIAEREEQVLRRESEEREHITRAAILIMQGKMVEADKEIAQMGGVLAHPSLEATNVFRSLGTWNAMNGDLEASAECWLAMSRVNRFDENDMSYTATEDLLPVSPLLVTIKDFQRYDEFRSFLIAKLGQTKNPVAAEHVLKMCLLRPTSPELQKALIPVMEIAKQYTGNLHEVPIDRMEAWRCIVVGLWYYRNGDYQTAVDYTSKALQQEHPEDTRPTMAKLVRAMAYIKLGNRQKANQDLTDAGDLISNRFMTPLDLRTGGYWHDWLNNKILQQEAEALQFQVSDQNDR